MKVTLKSKKKKEKKKILYVHRGSPQKHNPSPQPELVFCSLQYFCSTPKCLKPHSDDDETNTERILQVSQIGIRVAWREVTMAEVV